LTGQNVLSWPPTGVIRTSRLAGSKEVKPLLGDSRRGELGQPEDVVSFAAFLCSDAASHLSDTLLPIRPITG